MSDIQPIPDPRGALDPPHRYPPTAVGAATPEPEPGPEPLAGQPRVRGSRRSSRLGSALDMAIVLPLVGLALGVRAVRRLIRGR